MKNPIYYLGNTIFMPFNIPFGKNKPSVKYYDATYGQIMGDVYTEDEVIERVKSFHGSTSTKPFNITDYQFYGVKPVKTSEEIFR